jgi:hypothetical protein
MVDAGPCGACPAGFTCSTSGTYCVNPRGVPAFDHVYLVVMENTSQSNIQGSSSAPYINKLMGQYCYTTNYSTSYHPSLPNYIDMTSGSTQGLSCDCQPTGTACDPTCAIGTGDCGCPVNAANLGAQLDAVTVPWRDYGESMGTPCNQTADTGTGSTHYAPKHVPFLYYDDLQSECAQNVRDYADFAGDLSKGTYRFQMVAPNLCDDMHGDPGCPSTSETTQGDTWLSTEVPKILAAPGMQAGGKDVLFIVWDEQTNSVGNASTPMLLIIVSPLVKAGTTTGTAYTHESLLATFEDAFSLPRLAGAATVPSPINDVWK